MIVQVLRRTRGREIERMYRALDIGRAEVDAAVARLERIGVLTVGGKTVRASAALACLESLNLIAV